MWKRLNRIKYQGECGHQGGRDGLEVRGVSSGGGAVRRNDTDEIRDWQPFSVEGWVFALRIIQGLLEYSTLSVQQENSCGPHEKEWAGCAPIKLHCQSRWRAGVWTPKVGRALGLEDSPLGKVRPVKQCGHSHHRLATWSGGSLRWERRFLQGQEVGEISLEYSKASLKI